MTYMNIHIKSLYTLKRRKCIIFRTVEVFPNDVVLTVMDKICFKQ